ncbi:MAG: hypothetical protein U5K79_03400 [Cyclobacteriaceae bacterium]|nr:hypothetical protein [Cyclobacteriaceae bacterium]
MNNREHFIRNLRTLLQSTTTDFKRYLYDKYLVEESNDWDYRALADVGKTTMILQYIKENLKQ